MCGLDHSLEGDDMRMQFVWKTPPQVQLPMLPLQTWRESPQHNICKTNMVLRVEEGKGRRMIGGGDEEWERESFADKNAAELGITREEC